MFFLGPVLVIATVSTCEIFPGAPDVTLNTLDNPHRFFPGSQLQNCFHLQPARNEQTQLLHCL